MKKKNKIVLISLAVIVLIISTLIVFLIYNNTPPERCSNLISGFNYPDQSTPERMLRTFWCAIINGDNEVALACIDRDKVDEGCHDCWNYSRFVSEFSNLDTSDFRFIASETRASIESPHHMMDYDIEKQGDGTWLIVSIHP